MFMFGYGYLNMNIFVTSQVTKVILEPFCKVEPYIRRKFLEEQMRICQIHFLSQIHSPFFILGMNLGDQM